MSNLSEFEAAPELGARRRPPTRHVGIDFESGEATFDANPDEQPDAALERLVRELWSDVDAPTLAILRVTEVTFWGDPDKPNKRFKAKVDERPRLDGPDAAELRRLIRRHSPHRTSGATDERDLNVVLSDWQVGKAGEKGGGTPELVARIDRQLGKLQDHARDLRRARPFRRINVLKAGDVIDQCDGFGPVGKQLWMNDLNLTEQVGLACELDVKVHRVLAKLADRVDSYSVASNHGQPRMSGHQATDDGDSYDLLVHRWTASVLAENPDAYSHVRLLGPQDPLVAHFDSYGFRVGLAHGHQASGGGGKPIYKLWEWWKGQHFGGLFDVDLMVVGHYHHPYLLSQSGRTLMGAPANDGGSRWLTIGTGEHARSGTLVFTTSADGWDDYRILA